MRPDAVLSGNRVVRLASESKSLAQNNKSSDGGKATNQQTYRALTLSVFIRTRAPMDKRSRL